MHSDGKGKACIVVGRGALSGRQIYSTHASWRTALVARQRSFCGGRNPVRPSQRCHTRGAKDVAVDIHVRSPLSPPLPCPLSSLLLSALSGSLLAFARQALALQVQQPHAANHKPRETHISWPRGKQAFSSRPACRAVWGSHSAAAVLFAAALRTPDPGRKEGEFFHLGEWVTALCNMRVTRGGPDKERWRAMAAEGHIRTERPRATSAAGTLALWDSWH